MVSKRNYIIKYPQNGLLALLKYQPIIYNLWLIYLSWVACSSTYWHTKIKREIRNYGRIWPIKQDPKLLVFLWCESNGLLNSENVEIEAIVKIGKTNTFIMLRFTKNWNIIWCGGTFEFFAIVYVLVFF